MAPEALSSHELRALQAPLERRYDEEPEAALVTLVAEGSLEEGIRCSVQTGRALASAAPSGSDKTSRWDSERSGCTSTSRRKPARSSSQRC
jgi:hypothetical protein